MTHVDWHPVEVNYRGKIIKGDRPPEMTTVYVTYGYNEVDAHIYIDDADGFGDGYPNPDLESITAWAYVDMPEPYKPESKNE